jgi:phosphodiesterase/alkaline phosphatase D-like protein
VASSRFLAACATPAAPDGIPFVDAVWDCGVASGVHAPDAAVLWTRCVPGATGAVDLLWEVATDPGFARIVSAGTVTATPDGDGTAKVLAEGLAPGGTYWYRFRLGSEVSPVGRTRTPAAPGTTPASVRLGAPLLGQHTAEVLGDLRGPKIVIQKFKNKTGYKKRQGFRADLTRVKITGIK